MVTVDNSNESRTRGCLKTNRLYCVSLSLVLLIAVAILFPNLFNEEFRLNQSSMYSSSPYNEDSKASFLKGLSGSTDKGSKNESSKQYDLDDGEEIIIASDETAEYKSIPSNHQSGKVPVYWVNLQKSKSRRKYFVMQMESLGLPNQRIKAVTPSDTIFKNTTVVVIPTVQQTPVELSCVISHLVAIHAAVYDETNKDKEYALITEDDVCFELDVDFLKLAQSAPRNFGALQLMTSSSPVVKDYWKKYKHELGVKMNNSNFNTSIFPNQLLWKRRKYDSQYWSTQAYLINKKVVKSFIDRIVSYNNKTSSYRIRILTPSEKLFPCSSKDLCYIPYRIVGDTYLYSGLDPTYLSRIPLFNGADVGENSTIHTKKMKNAAHKKSFSEIAVVIDDVRSNPMFLPSYIRVKNYTNAI